METTFDYKALPGYKNLAKYIGQSLKVTCPVTGESSYFKVNDIIYSDVHFLGVLFDDSDKIFNELGFFIHYFSFEGPSPWAYQVEFPPSSDSE